MGVGGPRHVLATLPLGRRPSTHCTGGWVGPRDVLDRCGDLVATGIRSLDRPAGSESLYQLHSPGPLLSDVI